MTTISIAIVSRAMIMERAIKEAKNETPNEQKIGKAITLQWAIEKIGYIKKMYNLVASLFMSTPHNSMILSHIFFLGNKTPCPLSFTQIVY